jgi:superfamily II DNA/RNA helicase
MIVKLRRRTWRVEAIRGDALTATPIDDFGAPAQHFLLDLEHPEPGALPPINMDALGDHALQSLFLQAVRLDALHGTAPFVAIQRTAVIPVEYQLVPLVMALRQQPARLLIADTTGLGKTIEAGLIVSELLARSRAQSVLIITPANLRSQWRQQMRDLFYIDAEIISSETRRRLERSIPPGADPWLYFDKLIVSIDYAKDNRIKPEILKRKWDIVVVDECHNAAMPHSQSGHKADMDRWEAIRDIASRASEHLLLLSATPHNGYSDSYCSLLEMLSPDLVASNRNDVAPNRAKAVHHVCQRTRNDVQKWFEDAGQVFPFPDREPAKKTEAPVRLHNDYFRALEKLDKIMDFVGLHAAQAGKQQPVEWLRLHLHRRALSSPEALRKSLQNRIEKLSKEEPPFPFQEGQEGRGEVSDNDVGLALLSSLGDHGGADIETEEDRDRKADHALLSIEVKLQCQFFKELLDELNAIKPSKDRKLIALRDQVIPELLSHAGPNTPGRVIVFTRFKDTLFYLQKELGRGADYKIICLHGDLSDAERDRLFSEFAASDRAVLLATDVISEGLNLQNAAAMVVHADLPYNPNRLDQRNGRVDRFGQRSPIVYIRTLYCLDTTDEDVMQRLVRKLDAIRRDLGFSPPFFATEETVLRVLTSRRNRRASAASSGQMGLFDEAPEEVLFDETALDRMKSDGFYGQADVRISDVTDRLREAHSRFGSPAQIRHFIKSGLRRYNCSVEERPGGVLRIAVNNPRLRIPGMPDILEKVVLNPEEQRNHPGAVVLDVGHPLVRRLNAVIRENALHTGREGKNVYEVGKASDAQPQTSGTSQTSQTSTASPPSAGARTAAYAVAGLSGTILIGHGLLRATSQTSPPTLLEEIVTFGVRAGLGGIKALDKAELDAALMEKPSHRTIARDHAMSAIARICALPQWTQAVDTAKAQALAGLEAHRQRLKEELGSTGHQKWLDGFDDISPVGFDLYCVTLLEPEGL